MAPGALGCKPPKDAKNAPPACSPKFIHRPWDAPDFARLRYPAPMVDHATARDRALKAFKTLPKAE